MRKFLRSKIHQARVTSLNPGYEGSITICRKLLQHAGILEYEHVLVADIETGVRFETYAIAGSKGVVAINGAAANLNISKGDRLIIMSFEYDQYPLGRRTIVVCDDKNKVEHEA